MPKPDWPSSLEALEALERTGGVGYEYGTEARRLLTEHGPSPCDAHDGAQVVLDTAVRMTTARSLSELCLDMPGRARATDRSSRRLVMQAARLRVKAHGSLKRPLELSTTVCMPTVGVATRPREARGRRDRPGSSRASPDGDPEPPRCCAYCGALLTGRRPQARTCSDSHRVMLHRRRKAGA